MYIFVLMWSIGAFLELDDRVKLEEFMRKDEEIKLDLPEIPADADYNMYDFYVNQQGQRSTCTVDVQ